MSDITLEDVILSIEQLVEDSTDLEDFKEFLEEFIEEMEYSLEEDRDYHNLKMLGIGAATLGGAGALAHYGLKNLKKHEALQDLKRTKITKRTALGGALLAAGGAGLALLRKKARSMPFPQEELKKVLHDDEIYKKVTKEGRILNREYVSYMDKDLYADAGRICDEVLKHFEKLEDRFRVWEKKGLLPDQYAETLERLKEIWRKRKLKARTKEEKLKVVRKGKKKKK